MYVNIKNVYFCLVVHNPNVCVCDRVKKIRVTHKCAKANI